MASCPLCSDILLRHIRAGQSYWLCRRCRLEILEKKHSFCDLSHVLLPEVAVKVVSTSQRGVPVDQIERQLPPRTILPPIKTEV